MGGAVLLQAHSMPTIMSHVTVSVAPDGISNGLRGCSNYLASTVCMGVVEKMAA